MGERGSRPEIDIRDIPEEQIIEDDRPVPRQEVPVITPSGFQRIFRGQDRRRREKREKSEGPN